MFVNCIFADPKVQIGLVCFPLQIKTSNLFTARSKIKRKKKNTHTNTLNSNDTYHHFEIAKRRH